MNKIRVLLKLDQHTLLLFIEAFIYLAIARLLLLRPFMKIAPSLGARTEVTPEICEDKQVQRQLKKIASAIDIMSRNTFWESKCFVRAIACMKMLKRRNISSTIYLGTGKDEHGKLIAHAWLRSGPIYLSGAEVMKEFVVVETFASKASFTA
ncbi:lasso peptide biosynthesis B2 protein [Paenibacillus sp. L3-i20]|uniref:lasso peptide biosynthesis B2 protein n=1 Tax=Paenibacillus sp. L3-i20 TaxID=2905833 RepID=UPI001EDDA872|nr:lasso peptide biosynthesis B2 protein [Paenibacillus sp. L3-i20]